MTAATAALMVGPLAAAGAAAENESLLDPVQDLTCAEAKETELAELIKEFCDDPDASATESPLDKSVDEVTDTVDKAVDDTTADAPTAGGEDGGGEDGGGDGETDPGTVLTPEDPTKRPVRNTGGDDGFEPVDGSATQDASRARQRARAKAAAAESAGFGYNADGPFRPGMRSHSSLTLQPFAAPLVSVPPVYELPQIASQLFGTDAAVSAEDPQVAGGAATATGYSATGYTATSADPTGWLAATATGLIMLVGAAHAINGGRTPKGNRA